MSRIRMPSVSAGGDYGKGLFNREMGPLQSQLRQGEYALLRLAPMLESEFVQVNKQGELVDVHKQIQTVIIGIACTCPNMLVPNVLLLARPIYPPEESFPKFKSLLHKRPPGKMLELTRLLPLRFVKISVHNIEKKQLRFKLASGRTFYMQLCPQQDSKEDVFRLWVKAVHMLRPQSEVQSDIQHPSVDREVATRAPSPQRPQSPGSLKLDETVSIRSIYTPSESPTPVQEDAISRRSLVLSMGSQPSYPATSRSPAVSVGRTSEYERLPLQERRRVEERTERSPSRRTQGSERERPRTSGSRTRKDSKSRRASRSRRRKSPRKSSSRKPSKIISLITACSWGSQRRSRSRDSRVEGKGKKR